MVEMLGREAECRLLEGALDAARSGSSGVLVIRAQAGMGKSRLLHHAIDVARDFRLAHIEGVESEMELGYAGLHRLLLPFLDHVAELPAPQQQALDSAFGRSLGGTPDRFLVGLATLSLLDRIARDGPLLCAVDDAQWLDRESLEALALVGRRLDADRVAMLFAARDASSVDSTLDGLRVLRLRGLDERDAESLIRQVVDGHLDQRALRRIIVETAGNPLAIIELAREFDAEELALRGLRPDPLPIGSRLLSHFANQAASLPTPTRELLLVAAAEPTQDPSLIVEAARLLDVDAAAADPAAAAAMFSLDSRPLFRHPLVRAAIYSGASATDRRRAHAALATATGARGDADRRAWHRAAATVGADEDVAADLERVAERERARGGYSAAGVFLARAAELSPDADRRTDRVLAAATSHLTGGAPARARALLDEAELQITDPWQRAMAMRLDGAIAHASGDMPTAVLTLVRAAEHLARFDVALARTTLLHAATAARFAGVFCPENGRSIDVARAAARLPLPAGVEATTPHLLLDAYVVLHLHDHEAALPLVRRALASLTDGDLPAEDALSYLETGCWVAGAIADDEALHALSTRLVDLARARGALVHLSSGLLYSAMSQLLRGSLPGARDRFAERSELLSAMGVDGGDVGRVVVSAWSGPADEVRTEIARIRDVAAESKQGWMLVFIEYAHAILELGLGNYEAAAGGVAREYEDDSFLVVVGFPNTVEALARSGRLDEAKSALGVFAARTEANATNLSLGLLARTRALLADDAEVDELCHEAIERLERSGAELQLGRAHLLYGEWLRRQKRRTEARAQLRTAHELFADRGVGPFAERARIELEATGERARARTVDTARDLTPQERQIALLASESLTNAEIATKLYLSSSTVDYHLRKVYRKLDIDSRRQLQRALGAAR